MYEHTVQCNAVSRGRMMRTGTAMQQLPAGTIIRCRCTHRTAVSCEQPRRLLDKRCSTKSLYITSSRVSASRVAQSPASRPVCPHRPHHTAPHSFSRHASAAPPPCILHTCMPIPCPCPCLWITLARKKVVPHCACRLGSCAVHAVECVRATTSSRIQPLLDRVHTCRYSKRRMQKQVGMWGLLLMSESGRTSGWCCVRCALSLAHGCYKPFFTTTQPRSLYA